MTSRACDLIICIVFTCVSGGLIQNGTLFFTDFDSSIRFSGNIGGWITNGNEISIETFNKTDGFSMACDAHRGHVVISNPRMSTLHIYDVISDRIYVFYIGTSKDVGQVAVDWRAGNVYWADAGYGWVAMKELPDDFTQHNSLDPHFRVLIDRRLDTPTGLAVFPQKYFLFWADAGAVPKIERSDLIGRQRKVIVYQSLLTPRGLAVDHSSERLYWTDESRGTVESCDVDGNGRSVLLSTPGWAVYGIAVYQGSILCTATFGNDNYTMAIPVERPAKTKYARHAVQFAHLALYSQDSQPRDQDSRRCDSSQRSCDQICVLEDDIGNTECYCQDGYKEVVDGTRFTCVVDQFNIQRSLLFTNADQICAINVNILTANYGLGSSYVTVHCHVVTSELGSITRFATDVASSEVYFTNGTHIARQTVFNHTEYAVITPGVAVVDMDFDWISRQLFWIENATSRLFYTFVNGSAFEILAKSVSSGVTITNLAVDPHTSHVYFITRTDGAVYRMHAWARHTDTLTSVPVTDLVSPTDLEYDRIGNRLVWNDDGGFVGFLSLKDGRQTRTTTSNANSKRYAALVYKNFVVFTSAGAIDFHVLYEKDPDPRVEGVTLVNVTRSDIRDLHVWDSALQPQNLGFCDVSNGNCQQICLPDERAERCACALGYTLNVDGRTCSTGFMSSDYIVILDEIHNRLYQIPNSENVHDAHSVETRSSDNISALAFDSNSDTVVWNDRSVNTVRKKKIGSSQITTLDINTGVDTYLAIDGSTGNVYVLADNSIRVADGAHVYTVVQPQTTGRMKHLALASQKGRMAWCLEETSPTRKVTIVRANMDGTSRRDIAVPTAAGSVDDLAFDPVTGDVLFWCNSEDDEVQRVDVSALTAPRRIYQGQQLRPVAIDVAGQDLYLVPRDQRKLLRVSSVDGSGNRVVFESPLLGSLNNFYVKQGVAVPVHHACSTCNGECSHVCLPDGYDVTCACPDEEALQADGKTCPAAKRCQEASHSSIKRLDDCCPSQPGALCLVTCADGFTQKTPYSVECKPNGEWNVSMDSVCAEERSASPVTIIAAAASGGGGAVVVIIIVIVVCCCISRNKTRTDLPPPQMPSANGLSGHDGPATVITDNDRSHGYTTLGAASADPPRPMTREEEADGGVYHELDETALRVELPPKSDTQDDILPARCANKYSRFPTSDEIEVKYSGYLTPVAVGVPPPDYPDFGGGPESGTQYGPWEDADGYLATSSVSGVSLAEARLGDLNIHAAPDSARVAMGRYNQGIVSFNAGPRTRDSGSSWSGSGLGESVYKTRIYKY